MAGFFRLTSALINLVDVFVAPSMDEYVQQHRQFRPHPVWTHRAPVNVRVVGVVSGEKISRL
jgi:hypothetical protein